MHNAWPVGLTRLYLRRSSDAPSVSIRIGIFHVSSRGAANRFATIPGKTNFRWQTHCHELSEVRETT